MPHGNLPKLSEEEVDKSSGASQALCSTPEMTRSGGNQSNTTCESAIARNNDVEPIVTTCETFCNSDSADHNATCKHAGLSQARSTGIVDKISKRVNSKLMFGRAFLP